MSRSADPLARFHAPVREWFQGAFREPTPAQRKAWPPILDGRSTLLLAPTGSGKTLAAFLAGVDRLMFPSGAVSSSGAAGSSSGAAGGAGGLRVLYISPLKALAVDVERNLRFPLAGIAAVAERGGVPFRLPEIAIRSGDTPARDRARMGRRPPDILITTPESLYLILTSSARGILATVEAAIVDEIHSLVPTKRGAHLALSLERLEALRPEGAPPLQRIGLSATQRPLEEVARFLGGGSISGKRGAWTPRPVEIVDAGRRKPLEVQVEVPVEDMARLSEPEEIPSGPAASGPKPRSIWPAICARLVELVRAHRSTMVFVNSRRLAERVAAAVNDAAGAEIALAHHGSVAKEKRAEIEDRLKRGLLPAIVATSSLELGIDMGAVDLVVQVEAPPSVASGLQRIGRASHSVGAVSRGILVPKFRGDLVACAAAVERMRAGDVEETFYPRNPLDVLAQQIVAAASVAPLRADDLFDLARRAAPFAELPRSSFEGVLDMLAGRYPSDEFAGLRARIVWDRLAGTVRGRQGAREIAVTSGGTIPDRGLYGVFLAGDRDGRTSRRVGELDEEMVFESRSGDVFVLGASSWRIDEIAHDRVLVTPAPGEPGKMPFWHGDRPGRPLEFGRAIGAMVRKLSADRREVAERRLREEGGLDRRAASNLLAYLRDQGEATGEVPSDRMVVVERHVDDTGDWRICILSPFGARVHAPWALAAVARLREKGLEAEMLWSDDGIVLRLPESPEPPDPRLLAPSPDEARDLVTRELPGTALFAARFRENAARALLLPRRRFGQRSPLWAQRKRSADLLAVASRYESFPIILETYRECLRDVFDLPGLAEVLRGIEARRIRLATVDTRSPSPFAAAILFSYVGNFIYEGDAPLAERRVQILSIDQAQLRDLLGEAELRELLDPEAIEALELALQHLDGSRPARGPDGVHDLLLALGPLSEEEIRRRTDPPGCARGWIEELAAERRAFRFRGSDGPERIAAAEDAARLRDALGAVLPPGLPAAFLEPVEDPLGDLVSRYARTHGPFHVEEAAGRLGIGTAPVREALERLAAAGRAVEGEFIPGGRGREWCSTDVLRTLKRRSLAKLRREVEPVDPAALGRLLPEWQGVARPRSGDEGILAAVEGLEGCPLHASVLESEVLPARIAGYRPADLDAICATGGIVWRGIEALGPSDGKIALYRRETFHLLAPPAGKAEGDLAASVRSLLEARGALFFGDLLAITRAFPPDLAAALWDLVWAGEATNDTIAPLRSLLAVPRDERRRGRPGRIVRPSGPPGTEGRWSLLPREPAGRAAPTETERRAALARALLERHGILTREAVGAEGVPGGFSAVYEVLKAMEEAGRVRRGYFVAGLGALQFALPGADDRLRSMRDPPEDPEVLVLSATDPASPYGAALPWPAKEGARLERRAGARVLLRGGELIGYLNRTEGNLHTFLPADEPARGAAGRALAGALAEPVEKGDRRAFLVPRIDGGPPEDSLLAPYLLERGFTSGYKGFLKRGEI
jgi:ATP-dependent Lhr-like helicase